MPIQIPSFLIPVNGNSFYLLEDRYLKGGLQVVADALARDAIPVNNLKAGMVVVLQTDNSLWQLGVDLQTWSTLQTGGSSSRRSLSFTTPELQPNGFVDFTLDLGKTAMVVDLSVTVPVMVEAFSTQLRGDSNPYRFLATADHLDDDGTTLMSDGTSFFNRRYITLANQEVPPSVSIPFRITNTGQFATSTTLNVTFLTLE